MLRPERMSKVSVTGARRVMESVVEAAHDERLLHLTEYDGSWEGFDPGDPSGAAETAAERLVTVRSLKSILGVKDGDAGPTRLLDDEEIEAELETVRERVNDLDDRRSALRDEVREVETRLETAAPFATLGVDLDLLSGYDTLAVAVGEGDPEAVERAVETAETLEEHHLIAEDGIVAVFARPADDAGEGALDDALVGTEFAGLDVPDAEGDPETYVADLEAERDDLLADLEEVEAEIETAREEYAGFLLAAEEQLSIEVSKAEAPLAFATTENAFVAEGWVPTERYDEFAASMREATEGHVEVEELERASFGADGTEKLREELPTGADAGSDRDAAAATDGVAGATDGTGEAGSEGESEDRSEEPADAVRADGSGAVVMRDDDPPVVQSNAGPVKPFEVLVRAVGRPQYTEFDPTVILFLTFPAFFGFMIGDVGYGLVYTAIGYYLYGSFESDAVRSMGGVTVAAGVFTTLFGFLYGEIFGLHQITELFWVGVVGLKHAPIEKGLSPATVSWAQAWLVVSLLVGIVHLNVGYAFDFVENLEFHGPKEAVLETGSWIVMLNALWVWVFSRTLVGSKPAFLYTLFDGTGTAPEASGEFAHAVVKLGFNGFPALEVFALPAAVPIVGGFPVTVPLLVFFLGLGLLVAGEPIEVVESLEVLVNTLSYTRLAAVLLAKAGMAFTVNLLFFGVYEHEGEFHFMLDHGPSYVVGEYGREAILFPGLVHGGAALLLLGLVVLVLGHALVLALGVTSAGLQAVRLEYVEFFGKFFEGGGKAYDPFGREREYTAEE